MKTNFAILISFLLITGIFATALASAEYGLVEEVASGEMAAPVAGIGWEGAMATKVGKVIGATEASVELEGIEMNADESAEAQEVLEELEKETRYNKIGFAKIWRGHGWIENSESGYLIRGFWIEQAFANVREKTLDSGVANSIDSGSVVPIEKAFGRIWIEREPYKLVKAPDYSEAQANFYIVPFNKEGKDEEVVRENSIGMLNLKMLNEYEELTTWEGSLELKEGDFEGSWDVSLGTSHYAVRSWKKPVEGGGEGEATVEGGEATRPFWKKVLGIEDKDEAERVPGITEEEGKMAPIENEAGKDVIKVPFWKRIFGAKE